MSGGNKLHLQEHDFGACRVRLASLSPHKQLRSPNGSRLGYNCPHVKRGIKVISHGSTIAGAGQRFAAWQQTSFNYLGSGRNWCVHSLTPVGRTNRCVVAGTLLRVGLGVPFLETTLFEARIRRCVFASGRDLPRGSAFGSANRRRRQRRKRQPASMDGVF